MTKQPNFESTSDLSSDETADIGILSSLPPQELSSLLDTVDVQIEQVSARQRQISAKIPISQAIEPIWQVLTDYEALADFIPNLSISQRLEHPTGGIRLEQVGTQRLLRFNFSARVVLDLEEQFPHEIHFNLVEGDLKAFSGTWRLQPDTLSPQIVTNLFYTVCVLPKRTMPISIIERRLANDLRLNLLAIRQRVNNLYGTIGNR
ncbi:SRPBCC family protein [Synechocystis sp. PCC 7509]|uniref:SRPBCC family protein n=1 Tax=Synechocystis sp. PCC 7509 TaxID=927677 RepID=UPI0002AC46ED|nr:SRPBCC family protein [Synechocystis sp. PCC 7509]